MLIFGLSKIRAVSLKNYYFEEIFRPKYIRTKINHSAKVDVLFWYQYKIFSVNVISFYTTNTPLKGDHFIRSVILFILSFRYQLNLDRSFLFNFLKSPYKSTLQIAFVFDMRYTGKGLFINI